MEEMGVPNPKTVELTIEPGGAWLWAVKACPVLGLCDKFTTAVKVQTTGAKPVIAENNVPAINLLDRFNLDRERNRQVDVAAIRRLLKEPGLKEEDMHIVQLVPEGMEPSLSTQGNVRAYRATLPSSELETLSSPRVFYSPSPRASLVTLFPFLWTLTRFYVCKRPQAEHCPEKKSFRNRCTLASYH